MSRQLEAGRSADGPQISVIIPTYNRRGSLLCTLESLGRQSYPAGQYEVIVVDDGSGDDTAELAAYAFPFALRYIRQENSGGVVARNRGAASAQGALLVFLDDDMTAGPDYLSELADTLASGRGCLVRGRLIPWDGHSSVFARYYASTLGSSGVATGDFASNNLGLWRSDFCALGEWRDVLTGASEHRGGIWSDLEFAVRAQKRGFALLTADEAEIVHRDYAVRTLESACERAQMVSRLAAQVLAEFPELYQHIPMVHDKAPISISQDPPALVLRKILRQMASSSPILWMMQRSVPPLERHAPRSRALCRLYRWIISGCIYRGYRAGLG